MPPRAMPWREDDGRALASQADPFPFIPAAVSMPFLAPTSITPAHTARDVPNDPAFSFSKWIGKFLAIGQSNPRH